MDGIVSVALWNEWNRTNGFLFLFKVFHENERSCRLNWTYYTRLIEANDDRTIIAGVAGAVIVVVVVDQEATTNGTKDSKNRSSQLGIAFKIYDEPHELSKWIQAIVSLSSLYLCTFFKTMSIVEII